MSVVRLAKRQPCPVCRKAFRPQRMGQKVCSPPCAPKYVRMREEAKREREERRAALEARKERREKLKQFRSLNEWKSIAQSAFNAYIRARDEGLPCISCGVVNPPQRYGGAWDAGHYRSRGAAPELRYEELNVHKQCKTCNSAEKHNSAKAETVRTMYRRGLIERIGLEAVEWLEGPHQPKHYTAADLEQIAKTYRAKTRELQKMRER